MGKLRRKGQIKRRKCGEMAGEEETGEGGGGMLNG